MLDRTTRMAALLALAYRGEAAVVAAHQVEICALLGDREAAQAWRLLSTA